MVHLYYLNFSRFSAFRYQILVCLGAPPHTLSIHCFPLNKTFGHKDRKKNETSKKVKKMLFPLNTSYYSGYVYENSGPLESKAGVFFCRECGYFTNTFLPSMM